jgi:undecaprenyl-diphosphatase
VHYPGDILGGAILGALIGWGIFRLLIKVEGRMFPVHPYQRTKINLRELEVILVGAGMVFIFTFLLVWLLQKNNLLS